MNSVTRLSAIVSAVILSAVPWLEARAQQQAPQAPNMTFFVTGAGPGKGADLGGIEGADRYCQQLAQQAGAGGKTWRAYLSTQAADGKPAINARDRIGRGPWQNFKGEVVAQSADDLHSDHNKLNAQTALTERGAMIPGVGYTPFVTTHSPAHSWMAAPSRPGKIGPATTGRVAHRDPRCWATSTERVCATIRLPIHGIRRIPRADRTAVAAKPICAALVAMDCSIALPNSRTSCLGWPLVATATTDPASRSMDNAN
jgi:hypothetical protein